MMMYIALVAVVGILLLQWTGSIPLSSVGGPMAIGLAVLAAAVVFGAHEAWTHRRGILGWITSIVVSLLGSFFAAQLGGFVVLIILSPFMTESSLAATGGAVLSVALAGMMGLALLGSWGALKLVDLWRSFRRSRKAPSAEAGSGQEPDPPPPPGDR